MQKKRNPAPGPETINPAAPRAASEREPYGSSGLLRVHRLLANASDESREFFETLMSEWEHGPYNLPETAFMKGAHAAGYGWIALDLECDKEHNEDLCTLYRIFIDAGNAWLRQFLQRMLHVYRAGTLGNWTPEDALFTLQNEMDDFDYKVEGAREILKNHPETITAEMREAIRKCPGLAEALKPAPAEAA